MNSNDATRGMAAAHPLIDALHTDRPGSDRADKMSLYGWSFTEIAVDSCHWLGERSLDNGATWKLNSSPTVPPEGIQRQLPQIWRGPSTNHSHDQTPMLCINALRQEARCRRTTD